MILAAMVLPHVHLFYSFSNFSEAYFLIVRHPSSWK